MQTPKEKELIDLLINSVNKKVERTGFICRVEVTNLVPSQYNVFIKAIGSDFDNRDGTTYRDVDDPINVGYGGIARTESNDATKCVKSVFTGIVIQQQGFPPTTLVHRYDAPSADQCIVRVPIILAPRPTIAESDLSGSIDKILVLE